MKGHEFQLVFIEPHLIVDLQPLICLKSLRCLFFTHKETIHCDTIS